MSSILLQIVRDCAQLARVLEERGVPCPPAVPEPEEDVPAPKREKPQAQVPAAPLAAAPPAPVPVRVIDPAVEASKEARLSFIEQQAKACQACRLAQGRKKVVFGEGSPSARVMFIGEGPGAEEDRTGRPFIGKSGQLLTKMLAAIGIARQDVYIANVVKCRPPQNRDPMPDETATCRPFLDAQIEAIGPEVIVCLGRPSAQSVMSDRSSSLSALRSRLHKLGKRDLLVTYHPAFLLRNPVKKRDAWADLVMLRELLVRKGLIPALPAPWWKE